MALNSPPLCCRPLPAAYGSPHPRRAHERGGALVPVLLIVVVLGLLAAVGYLAATINHGRYRLAENNGTLVVERGRLLPVGFEFFRPEAEALRSAYAPIHLPEGAVFDASEVYGERGDLDRAIFTLLAGWARTRISNPSAEGLEVASTCLERAELLPALSEEQRAELHRLHGGFAYSYALSRIGEIGSTLQKAREQLQVAVRLGAAEPRIVDGWLTDLASFQAEYDRLAARINPHAGTTTTAPQAAAALDAASAKGEKNAGTTPAPATEGRKD